jgi:hypothetical protein
MLRKLLPWVCLIYFVVTVSSQGLVNDRQIRVRTPADVATTRQALINYVWGAEGFPTDKLPRLPVIANDISVIADLPDLERMDTLVVEMEAGVNSYAHHFIPTVKNNRLVILHSGHVGTFDDIDSPDDEGFGMRRTVKGLLGDGYSVLAVYMPRNAQFESSILVSDDQGTPAHTEFFNLLEYQPRYGSPFKYFLEPIAVYLNYLSTRAAVDSFPIYKDYSIIGFSGGGWTATVYPAIDVRIKQSIAVAGSLPLYLRWDLSVGDAEQTNSGFYSIAGYPDLYVLASHGPGRKQIQILNRNDWCCFSEISHRPDLFGGMNYDDAVREYESNVREALIGLGNPDLFTVEIDDAAPGHNLTWDTLFDTILPELNQSRRHTATAGGAEAAARGNNGVPAFYINGGWGPVKLPPMNGTPAMLQVGVNAYEVFYRNNRNKLVHASRWPRTWARANVLLETKVISDPVAVSRGHDGFDVVVLGVDYKFYHVNRSGPKTSVQVVSADIKGLGQPTLIASGPDRLDLFYRGWNRKLYHGRKIGASPWVVAEVGGKMVDLPTAVRLNDGSFRVFVRRADEGLWESRRGPSDGDAWTPWESISAVTGSGPINGSPSAAILPGGIINVYARTPQAGLRKFSYNMAWSITTEPGSFFGSPTSSARGVFSRNKDGTLSHYNGARWSAVGGRID